MIWKRTSEMICAFGLDRTRFGLRGQIWMFGLVRPLAFLFLAALVCFRYSLLSSIMFASGLQRSVSILCYCPDFISHCIQACNVTVLVVVTRVYC